MSTNENTVDSNTDDLDTFSAEFFGQNKAESEQASPGVKDTDDVESDAKKDTHSEETDTLANEEDDDAEVDETPSEEAPKPKKNRFQERIDELVKDREAEKRERLALEAKLELLLNDKKQNKETVVAKTEDKGPAADDKNEDGSDKYPLGEFDPQYIADMVSYKFDQKEKATEAARAQEAQQRELDSQRAAIEANWNEKLGPAKERYPDFDEKGQTLNDTFSGIDQAYGEYLGATLMAMDYGPDVLYYLANNVDEAQKIVAAGPTKATIALGRLEAKFAFADEEKQKARPKVSKAPTPPDHLNKGSAVARIDVAPDTDDLDAFSAQFFEKRRKV